jgi:hypothetical protein
VGKAKRAQDLCSTERGGGHGALRLCPPYGNCYRITEGSEEIQMRKVAGFLFGYMGPGKY